MKSTIDRDYLVALADGDVMAVRAIVVDFLEDTEKLLEKFELAQVEGDRDLCLSLVHQLKGSSGSLGLKELYKRCADFEAEAVFENGFAELRSLTSESVQQAVTLLDSILD